MTTQEPSFGARLLMKREKSVFLTFEMKLPPVKTNDLLFSVITAEKLICCSIFQQNVFVTSISVLYVNFYAHSVDTQ